GPGPVTIIVLTSWVRLPVEPRTTGWVCSCGSNAGSIGSAVAVGGASAAGGALGGGVAGGSLGLLGGVQATARAAATAPTAAAEPTLRRICLRRLARARAAAAALPSARRSLFGGRPRPDLSRAGSFTLLLTGGPPQLPASIKARSPTSSPARRFVDVR